MGKMTFDASRCVDYLETVPEIDKEKIGCIGFSLGAKEVLYAMAFEPRYRAGVFNEGGIGLRIAGAVYLVWIGIQSLRSRAVVADEITAAPARRGLLGTGYVAPHDVELSADGLHAYVTDSPGSLLRLSLTNMNRSAATVVGPPGGLVTSSRPPSACSRSSSPLPPSDSPIQRSARSMPTWPAGARSSGAKSSSEYNPER